MGTKRLVTFRTSLTHAFRRNFHNADATIAIKKYQIVFRSYILSQRPLTAGIRKANRARNRYAYDQSRRRHFRQCRSRRADAKIALLVAQTRSRRRRYQCSAGRAPSRRRRRRRSIRSAARSENCCSGWWSAKASTAWSRRRMSRRGKISPPTKPKAASNIASCCRVRPLHRAEWEACLDRLVSLPQKPKFVVASGSVPPGVPDDFFARVVAIAKRHGRADRGRHLGRGAGRRAR